MMVISLRKWLMTVKYALIFMALAYVFYHSFGMLKEYVFLPDKYRIPDGSAVKVFKAEPKETSGVEFLAERLKLFFWYGE